jgi:hypothetical protein
MWHQIPGFPDYEITKRGRIRSWRKRPRFWRNPDPCTRRTTPIEMTHCVNKKGYRIVCLRVATGGRKNFLVHRLLAITFLPNPHNLPDVAHLNGNTTDCCLDNIAWMSHQDNQLMMQKHGTQGITKKLTADQVKYIREQVAYGPRGTARRMCEKFGVTPTTVHDIVHWVNWRTYWD